VKTGIFHLPRFLLASFPDFFVVRGEDL